MTKAKLSSEWIQKIKDSINITDVVGEHVVLKSSGSNATGLCPFHSERTPSFSVSSKKQLYHCYGCKAGGDVISFVMEVNGLSFSTAVLELADKAQIKIPKEFQMGRDPAGSGVANDSFIATAHKLNRFVAAFYRQNLFNSKSAQDYLAKRVLSSEAEKNFYLGYASEGWEELTKKLSKSKAPMAVAEKLGLIQRSKKEKPTFDHFDLFRGRVVFPILNSKGKVAGFGGRLIHQEGQQGPKYLNSPDSEIFQKSKLLYGLYQAKKYIREQDEVILVEGFFDVLSLVAAGVNNVVATCGTQLSVDHLKILSRFGKKVTIIFDGDKAGQDATLKAMRLGLKSGLVLNGVALPNGLDPDELLSKNPDGKEILKESLTQSKPIIDAQIDQQIAFAKKGPEAQTNALKQVFSWLGEFKDPVGKRVRLEYIKNKMSLSSEFMNQMIKTMDIGSLRLDSPVRQKVKKVERFKGESSLSESEAVLLRAMVLTKNFTLLWEKVRCDLPPHSKMEDLFDYLPAKKWIKELKEQAGGLNQFFENPQNYLGVETDFQVKAVLAEALVADMSFDDNENAKTVIEQRGSRLWARFSHAIKEKLDALEGANNLELQVKLMKEYLDVQKKIKERNRFYG